MPGGNVRRGSCFVVQRELSAKEGGIFLMGDFRSFLDTGGNLWIIGSQRIRIVGMAKDYTLFMA